MKKARVENCFATPMFIGPRSNFSRAHAPYSTLTKSYDTEPGPDALRPNRHGALSTRRSRATWSPCRPRIAALWKGWKGWRGEWPASALIISARRALWVSLKLCGIRSRRLSFFDYSELSHHVSNQRCRQACRLAKCFHRAMSVRRILPIRCHLWRE
jgi:hypothetical protein